MEQYRGTTVLSVRRGNKVVLGADGQVTMGNTVMKGYAHISLVFGLIFLLLFLGLFGWYSYSKISKEQHGERF